ncbi:CHASE sensor domain-containing protein [Sphingosinicella sp. LY1275]|uniref:CHASE sensor domain-containing protein n=1 Tax=Sphingosinicella sp. LY1275 TaxID=3095379 RepID=UPI002ADEE55E|nr:ATP-binding protein [Sphingosinicella sp. LY1275]MEA1014999.1 CHASE sensor domain-containing protein [Sphingosinicella sp. LY1275]
MPAAAILLAALLLLAGLGVIFQNEASHQRQKLSETRVQAEILAASVTAALDFGDAAAAQESVNALRANPQVQFAAIYNQSDRLVAGFERNGQVVPPSTAAIAAPGQRDIAATVPVLRDGERIGSVHLAIAREGLGRRVTRYALVSLFILMAAVIAIILGLAQNVLRRVNRELELRAGALAEANRELQIQIEERAKAEEQLRQAQKMQALGQLTGGIAHDFNNLLTVIQGSADILQRPNLSEEKRIRFADAIAQTARRAASLTSQLLAFARRQPLKPEVLDLNAHILGMAELLDRTLGERMNVQIELSPDLCAVKVDPTQLEAAVLNIAVNARDAMDEAGTLTIRTLDIPATEADGPRAGLAITDSGTGIDADTLARVFEPFFTTKDVGQGTGLGLSQVYGFAAQSGGDVTIDSVVGKGTTVTLILPCSEEAVAVPVTALGRVTGSGVTGRILVVDDNEEVGAFAEALLGELGHTVLRAHSGEEALSLAGEHELDAVFTDVVMPGMSGLELADQLRAERPDLPIVLTTGFSDRIATSGTGGLPVVYKPYRLETIATALDEAMSARMA